MNTETTSTLRDRILATSDSSPSLLEDLQRESLRSFSDEVVRWHRETVEPLQRSARQLSATGDALRAAFTTATEEGRRDLARLQKTAHRLTRSRARLSVRLLEFLDSLTSANRDFTAGLVSRAFLGDAEAREYWQERADAGDETALKVAALLEELDALTESVSTFLDLAAETITAVSLPTLDLDTTGDVPPPDVILCGSVSRNAP